VVAVHFHHHSDPVIERRLDRIEAALETIIGDLKRMALNFDSLETAMSENSSAIDSAIKAFQDLAQAFKDEAANQSKVLQLADQLHQRAQSLAGAIVTNTPADPGAAPAA
jgi:chromosome segregation ATPase